MGQHSQEQVDYALFTVVFLEIHPFQDGNSRLSRILTSPLLLKADYIFVPYSSLEKVIEHSRESYCLALLRTQATLRTDSPDWQPWVNYFLLSLTSQKGKLVVKIERERLNLGDLPQIKFYRSGIQRRPCITVHHCVIASITLIAMLGGHVYLCPQPSVRPMVAVKTEQQTL